MVRCLALTLAVLAAACDSGTEPEPPDPPVPPALSLTKTAIQASTTAPAPIGFVIRLANNGGPATQVEVRDTLPTGTTAGWAADRAECAMTAGRILTCAPGSLPGGAEVEVQVTAFASTFECGSFSSTAHAAADSITPLSAAATVDVACPEGQPAGELAGTTPVAPRPFSLAVSALGDIYIARLDSNVARGIVPLASIAGSINVGSTPRDVDFSPDGVTAYVTNEFSSSVSIVDVGTHTETGTVGVLGSPFRVAVSPSGDRVYVTGNASRVFVIDPSTEAVVDTVLVDSDPNGLVFSPDGNTLYVSSSTGTSVSEISRATHTVTRTFALGQPSQELAISPDGETLYVAIEGAGLVNRIDLGTGNLLAPIDLPGNPRPFGMAMTPSGAQLYVTGGFVTGVVFIVDLATEQTRELVVGGNPRRIAFTADGSMAFVTNEDGWIDLVE